MRNTRCNPLVGALPSRKYASQPLANFSCALVLSTFSPSTQPLHSLSVFQSSSNCFDALSIDASFWISSKNTCPISCRNVLLSAVLKMLIIRSPSLMISVMPFIDWLYFSMTLIALSSNTT